MLELVNFSLKSLSAFLHKLVLKTTRMSARNPIEMMVASLIMGSVTYVYLFNLAKSSDILASASIYQTSSLSTVLYASPYDTALSPLQKQSIKDYPFSRLELKQVSIAPQSTRLTQDGLDNIIEFQDYIESKLHFTDEGWTFRDRLCYKPNNTSDCIVYKRKEKDNSISLAYILDLNHHFQDARLWEQKVMATSLNKLVPMKTAPHHSESISTILWIMRIIQSISRDTDARLNVKHVISLLLGSPILTANDRAHLELIL
jgi:hydroxymethylglutaryl-CoA reductase (NADPH)